MRHRRLEVCESTNDEARAAFDRGEPAPLLISSAAQTSGRGRAGRSWTQLPGNFAGTFLFDAPRALAREPGVVSLLSALAIREVLVSHGVEPAAIALKWPNDVLLREAKVAGILGEMLTAGRRSAILVGVGVNLAAAPERTRFRASAVFPQRPPDPRRFGEGLGDRLSSWINQVAERGVEPVFSAWRNHAWRRGRALTVTIGSQSLTGIFSDIDGHGRLILRLPDGRERTVSAGDTAAG